MKKYFSKVITMKTHWKPAYCIVFVFGVSSDGIYWAQGIWQDGISNEENRQGWACYRLSSRLYSSVWLLCLCIKSLYRGNYYRGNAYSRISFYIRRGTAHTYIKRWERWRNTKASHIQNSNRYRCRIRHWFHF